MFEGIVKDFLHRQVTQRWLAIFIVAIVQNILGLENISGDIQSLAIGLLLIVSVLGPNLARRIQVGIARRRIAVGSSKQV